MLSPQVTLAWYRVLTGPGKPGKFWILWHFLGLEGPGKRPLVLERSGNVFNSAKRGEMYGRPYGELTLGSWEYRG